MMSFGTYCSAKDGILTITSCNYLLTSFNSQIHFGSKSFESIHILLYPLINIMLDLRPNGLILGLIIAY